MSPDTIVWLWLAQKDRLNADGRGDGNCCTGCTLKNLKYGPVKDWVRFTTIWLSLRVDLVGDGTQNTLSSVKIMLSTLYLKPLNKMLFNGTYLCWNCLNCVSASFILLAAISWERCICGDNEVSIYRIYGRDVAGAKAGNLYFKLVGLLQMSSKWEYWIFSGKTCEFSH